MKFDLYSFKDGEVSLEFKFEQNINIIENKKKFIALLNQAAKVLSNELPTQIPPLGGISQFTTPHKPQ